MKKIRAKFTNLVLLTPLLFLAAWSHSCQAQTCPGLGGQNPSAQTAGMVSCAAPNSPPLSWTTPSGWTEETPSAMRVASFKIASAGGTTADVSIVPLPGMAGGDIPNVNRWRGQVGLPRASAEVLENSVQDIEAGGQPAQLYDLGGASSRILGVIQHRNGKAWFYKMTGDPNLVEQQKTAFVAFLQSLTFPPEQALSTLPPGHPDISASVNTAATSTAPIPHEGQPAWQVPSGWREIACGQFLTAKFIISQGVGLSATVNVSRVPGDGGGLDANVNRWRGQLGLPPAQDLSTVPVTVNGGTAVEVDLAGISPQTGRPTSVAAVVVTQGGLTWFYKLMGDAAVVTSQRDAFLQFVKGVRY